MVLASESAMVLTVTVTEIYRDMGTEARGWVGLGRR